MDEYDPKVIEPKWQEIWEAEHAFEVSNEPAREKSYVLEQLPYPSGSLHMGHLLPYTIGDVVTHFRRRSGFNVLHPMGCDAFGLPAENAAIKDGGHPREMDRAQHREHQGVDAPDRVRATTGRARSSPTTRSTTAGSSGCSCAASSAAWPTAERAGQLVPELPDRAGQRAGDATAAASAAARRSSKRELEQWFFRITAYADELLDGLDELDWPEPIKALQRNWIGRSEGARGRVRASRTATQTSASSRPGRTRSSAPPSWCWRPSTRWSSDHRAPGAARAESRVRRARPRRKTRDERSGRPAREDRRLHRRATPSIPSTASSIPIWVADYVLMDYGTGAIMAVPAHDQRDFEFARSSACRIVPWSIRPADGDGRRDAAVRRHTGDGAGQLRPVRRAAGERGRRRRSSSWLEARRARASARSTTACATG